METGSASQIDNALNSDTRLALWEEILSEDPHILEGVVPGSSIGLVSREVFDSWKGFYAVWEKGQTGHQVRLEEFRGFHALGVELLFVAEEDALKTVRQSAGKWSTFKSLVRQGDILCYFIKSRDELAVRGYDLFLEVAGISFMGGCR